MTNVVFLCTGNAARSVMATAITRDRAPHLGVRGAGTFSIPGLPMSQRTRQALAGIGLRDPDHRSHQLEGTDTDWADVIVAFEPEHIDYIRRKHPAAATITATLPLLAAKLPSTDAPLDARLDSLGLEHRALEAWEEVVDPAGGEQDVFDRCLLEISALLDDLLPKLP